MFKTIHKQNYPLLLVLPYSNQDRQCCRQLYHHGHTFSTKSDYTGLYFSTLYSSRIQSLQSFIINTLHGDHYKHVINGTYSGEHDRSVIQGNLLIAWINAKHGCATYSTHGYHIEHVWFIDCYYPPHAQVHIQTQHMHARISLACPYTVHTHILNIVLWSLIHPTISHYLSLSLALSSSSLSLSLFDSFIFFILCCVIDV